MNRNNILNAKIKILIIIAYTVVLFLIVFLIFGKTKADRFANYSELPYDEHMAVNVRVMENRSSLIQTYNSSNEKSNEKKLGLNEKSSYSLQLFLVKLKVESIRNISINVAAKTADNHYKYSTYSGTRSMSSGVFNLSASFSNFSTKEVIEKEMGIGSKMYVFDETPKEIYVNIEYTIGTGNDAKNYELKYRFTTLEIKEKNLSKYQTREFLSSSANNYKNFINPAEDVLAIKLSKEETGLKSSINEVYKDVLEIQVLDNIGNINKLLMNQDEVETKGLKAIEQATQNKDPLYPEISNIALEIWGKIESQDKKFSKYIKIYSLYGFFSKYRELPVSTLEIDESLNLSEIYVTANGTVYNGSVDSFEIKYQVNFHDAEMPLIEKSE